jgi:glutamine amidotransferase PdxT
MKGGVLAAQGAFVEHISTLHKMGVEALPVRLPRELDGLDGLIIPGGESTSISKLMLDYNLVSESHLFRKKIGEISSGLKHNLLYECLLWSHRCVVDVRLNTG